MPFNWNEKIKDKRIRVIIPAVILFIMLIVCIGVYESKIKSVGLNGVQFDTGIDTTKVINKINNGIEIGTMNGDILKDSAVKHVYNSK